MIAAGQAAAIHRSFRNVCGFPTEKDLATQVTYLPKQVHGRILGGQGTDMVPVTVPGQVVKVSIHHGVLSKLESSSNTFPLTDARGKPFGGGAYLTETDVPVSSQHRIVLHDKQGNATSLAVQERLEPGMHYTIYGLRPLLEGDVPTENEEGKNLYPWFRVRSVDDENHPDHRTVLTWDGQSFQPMLCIRPAKHFEDKTVAVQDDGLLPASKGDHLICDKDDDSVVYSLMCKRRAEHSMAGWDLCIAPGTDVVAMIMLAAVLENMNGLFG